MNNILIGDRHVAQGLTTPQVPLQCSGHGPAPLLKIQFPAGIHHET